MFAFMTRSGNDYLRHHSQQICLEHEPAQSHRHTEPPCVHQQHWEVAAQRNQLAEPGQGTQVSLYLFLACPALHWQKGEMCRYNSVLWDLMVPSH